MKLKFAIAAVILSVVLFSCSRKTTAAATEPATPVAIASAGEIEGKKLFENSCGRCHKLYDPAAFTKEEWKPIVTRMQRKAKLDDTQGAFVYEYLSAHAKK